MRARAYWIACAIVLAALVFGLDRYRRLPMDYGYGPDRRKLFSATLECAQRLEVDGRCRVEPDEKWHLVAGWEEGEGSSVLAFHRRAVLVLPILEPADLALTLDALPRPAAAVEIEYGVNGVASGRFTLPAEGGEVTLSLEARDQYRGDNALFLYRVSRRSDPSPWLALGPITFARKGS